jgi:hypothetical protein
MLTLALLAGIWTSSCIQTQISNRNQGFAKETYAIAKNGAVEFKREWFTDSDCTEPNGTDSETGTIVVGKQLNGFFITQETFEADFNTQGGIDLGAVSVANNKLRVARGVKNSSMRNTMLGLFDYSKQN